MAKKVKAMSEIQASIDRLQYLSGKILIMKSFTLPSEKERIRSELGYKKKEDADGKIIWQYRGLGTLEDTYRFEYKVTAEKLDKFYKVLDKISSERVKRVAELRYVDGYGWKDISEMVGESEQSMYSAYRPAIVDIFTKAGCGWAVGCYASDTK